MKKLAIGVLLWSAVAAAEQPRGTYKFDRMELTFMTDDKGHRHPSCGGETVFGGLATFIVEYGGKDKILVNGHEWKFDSYTRVPGESRSRARSFIARFSSTVMPGVGRSASATKARAMSS